jgi:hypothetical protein
MLGVQLTWAVGSTRDPSRIILGSTSTDSKVESFPLF